MIPEDKDQHHNTPKRFDFGYFCRETLELFYEGWKLSSQHMREDRKLFQAAEDRKHMQEILELAVYDTATRGTLEDQLKALQYLQSKKESDQRQNQTPYTWGEQLTSLTLNTAFLSAITILFSFTATWSCGRNQSQFCKDIRSNTGEIVRYFSDSKL